MRPLPVIAAIVSALALSWTVFAQGPARDGRWEISTEMEMPGLPMKIPATKTTQCITKEQASDPNQSLPKGNQDKNSDCRVTDQKVVGNTVTWTMKCEGKNALTGHGEITYGTNVYDGWMKMTTDGGEMTMKYKGKRLGDCTK